MQVLLLCHAASTHRLRHQTGFSTCQSHCWGAVNLYYKTTWSQMSWLPVFVLWRKKGITDLLMSFSPQECLNYSVLHVGRLVQLLHNWTRAKMQWRVSEREVSQQEEKHTYLFYLHTPVASSTDTSSSSSPASLDIIVCLTFPCTTLALHLLSLSLWLLLFTCCNHLCLYSVYYTTACVHVYRVLTVEESNTYINT